MSPYLIGDVGDNLNRAPQIIATTFFDQHIFIDPAGGDIGILVQVDVNEPLVMAQIQVGLCPVFGDEHFAMLIG